MGQVLSAGREYRFRHRRKGTFVATFVQDVPGDEADAVLWHVRIPTGPGSGQERLANSVEREAEGRKVTPAWSEKHLRPSLVEEVVPHGGK